MDKTGITETAPAFAAISLRELEPALPLLDSVGYSAVECWSGAVFDACLRRLGEEPWGRLRAIRRAMPNTPLQMTVRGQSLFGFRQHPDDIVRAFVRRACECGIAVVRVFDGMNDLRNTETAADEALRAGAHVQGGICYTASPIHSTDTFAALAKRYEQMGCRSVCLIDSEGIMPHGQCRELVYAIGRSTGLPVHLCAGNVYGLGALTAVKAVEGGARAIDCAAASVSGAAFRPPAEAVCWALAQTGAATGIEPAALGAVSAFFRQSALFGLPSRDGGFLPHPSGVPGSVMGALSALLAAQNAVTLLGEAVSEVGRVRAMLGYPPLLPPAGAIIAAQAVANVLGGGTHISGEMRALIAGEYGKPPGEIDRDLCARAPGGRVPGSARFADMLEPGLEKARAEIGHLARTSDDVLSYALFPLIAERFLQNRPERYEPEDL